MSIRCSAPICSPGARRRLTTRSSCSAADVMDTTFDEYARQSAQTSQDLGNIYAGINYLKHLDGEKHLVFVSEGGLFLPRLDNDHSIAALASDARVVIDTLMTGGVITQDPLRRDANGFLQGVNIECGGPDVRGPAGRGADDAEPRRLHGRDGRGLHAVREDAREDRSLVAVPVPARLPADQGHVGRQVPPGQGHGQSQGRPRAAPARLLRARGVRPASIGGSS